MRSGDLEALLREAIEEPAAERLASLLRAGVIKPSDVQRFNVSATQFKRAIVADYESFEPLVRDELRISLIKQYRETIEVLLAELVDRKAPGDEVDHPAPRVVDEEASASGPLTEAAPRIPRWWTSVRQRLDPR
ncbi:hypothetical protein [Symbioplanes lichenis]|uniref:hypothetical protein n=1 Tax=Symbioplanes lichenis TaxID=1629072 RepID=UPI002738451A|nr:hypothetical protein [Actinoplanes lichenis]